MTQRLRLQYQDDTVEFLPYGAQVLSWRSAGRERLFLSRKAVFEQGVAIRGGIPIIFPQFSTRGSLPRHGFARTQTWQVQALTAHSAHLRLQHNAATLNVFPHAFAADFFISLAANELCLSLEVSNLGDDVFDFTSALHSYFAVSDLDRVHISGLQQCNYEDALNKKRRLSDDGDLRFDREIDRIYQSNQLQLHDDGRRLEFSSEGFDDTVIWNPHASGASAIADLGSEEWRRFVCIEAANIHTRIVLPAGATNRAAHRIRVAS